MKKIFTLLFICFCSVGFIQAQDVEIYFNLSIKEATINDVDVTRTYHENEACMVFYKDSEGDLCFANVWKSSQSNGKTIAIENTEEDNGRINRFFFKWQYYNTYDNKRGQCLVEFLLDKETASYELIMVIPEDRTVMKYKGYIYDNE